MREIKFRAWSTYHGKKRMVYFGSKFTSEDMKEEPNWRIMQYTGLKDKNGKEIYEGDVVQVNHPHKNRKYRGQVIWNEYRWTGKDFFFSHLDVPQDLFCEGTEYIEVIGNIYENPELLSTP